MEGHQDLTTVTSFVPEVNFEKKMKKIFRGGVGGGILAGFYPQFH